MTIDIENERAAFEDWYSQGMRKELVAGLLLKNSNGSYQVSSIGREWQVWQARASIPPSTGDGGEKQSQGLVIPPFAGPASQQDAGASGWISVAVELPEVETDVLVYGKRGDSMCYSVAGIFNGNTYCMPSMLKDSDWMAQDSEQELRFVVSHWRPLPAKPVEQTTFRQVTGGSTNQEECFQAAPAMKEKP